MAQTVQIGKMNELELLRTDDKGGFLDAFSYGEVFLPLSQLPPDIAIGEKVNVFCYIDDGRLTVTAKRPKALLGELARLKVKDVTEGAAYLEWGIRKDLMVPFKEQRFVMKVDAEYVVYVTKDRFNRLYGSSKLNHFISDTLPKNSTLKVGDKVDIIAISKSLLGTKVAVNNSFYALLAKDEDVSQIKYGNKIRGVIQSIRPDRKVSVSLHALGQEGVVNAFDVVIMALEEHSGFLPLCDKSSPEEIEATLKMSKGKFKKVIGGLYKNHIIEIKDDGILLLKNNLPKNQEEDHTEVNTEKHAANESFDETFDSEKPF